MRPDKAAGSIVLACLVCACQSIGGAKRSDLSLAPYECQHECSPDDGVKAFAQALRICTASQNYYERGGFISKTARLVVAAVGTLAGTVAAPLAKGSGSDAWSGLSGATNALQTEFDQAFSNAVYVQIRAGVNDARRAGIDAFEKKVEPPDKVNAANAMAEACRTASADVEKEILLKLAEASDSVKDKLTVRSDGGTPASSSSSTKH